ncbi:3-phosphoshikimate 1-carboxyvinyltransferase [Blastococcus sp. PRF04-17]|uniref:3-phosphoshikimate 1-carboxyvinyltransferase n=1 Tax=Blastococcus sp. PRF04-17 TaxID=2933797 RepID=UPI001FF13002|nr:hypothetical protein [Blastococcus sp. PRF04-17]UOY01340.1 hypothetical protein MVA48_20730 [Blastococcus sp. PRF04-17]
MDPVWRTPHRAAPVDAVVSLPGSKSITARALIVAALADGPSRLVRPLRARDTDLMAGGLRALGVRIDDEGEDQVVTPGSLRGPAHVDAGLAGTILRFLPPVAALADGPVTVDGDPRLRDRPNAGLIQGLRDAGVRVDDDGRGRAPFTVHGTGASAAARSPSMPASPARWCRGCCWPRRGSTKVSTSPSPAACRRCRTSR